MKKNNKLNRSGTNIKGFTLVELVVVVAIIGILACLLVPTLIGYVRKAGRKVDMVTAKQIGESVRGALIEPEAYESFYKHNTTKFTVSYPGEESYIFVAVCKIDGIDGNAAGNPQCKPWKAGNNEAQVFVDELNRNFKFSVNEYKHGLPMKYVKDTSGNKLTRWVVGYRQNDKDHIEVWAADGTGKWGCAIKHRVWPAADSDYTKGISPNVSIS